MYRLPIKISQPSEVAYELVIGPEAYQVLPEIISGGKYSKTFVLSDFSVWEQCQELIVKFLPPDYQVILINAGEKQKTFLTLENVLLELSQKAADRRSLLINFGGGVIGDLGGFAASVYMRGIDFIQAPTTLLSQVDASVGGKTGVNLNHIKNLIGAFQQPKAVLINPATLSTLSERELSSGMAENVKHALITDLGLLSFLEGLTWPISDAKVWSELIHKSVSVKAQVVQSDPKESGPRKLLNFGHTAGHALESLCLETSEPLTHGEAISIGMVIEAELSSELASADLLRIKELLTKFNLPIEIPANINFDDFYTKLLADKKNTSQQIKWVLLKKIGAAVFDQQLEREKLQETFLKNLSKSSKLDSCLSLTGNVQESSVALKGSKSLTNRALILAAQAVGKSILYNPAICDDSRVMIAALEKFGIQFKWQDSTLFIDRPEKLVPYHGVIDIGPAGTSMRFLTSFIAGVPGAKVEIRGSERMHQRPINDLVDALVSQGVEIKYLGTPNCPPLLITGRVRQDTFLVDLNANISSQFLSSLLLSSSGIAKSVEIRLKGGLVSKSYIELTLQMMKEFGVNVVQEDYNYFLVFDSAPQPGAYQIDGDATGAGYFWCLAAATGKKITVQNLTPESKQGDLGLLPILEQGGCQVDSQERSIGITGAPQVLPMTADLEQLPDSAQTLAVLASLANGTTLLTGLSTLKNKETDRLLAISKELAKIGVVTEVGDDYIKVFGGTIKIPAAGVVIDTYDDHRMAMSFAILAAIYPAIKIANPEVVTKSFPDFWEQMQNCGLKVL